ncbi:MAG: ParB/RepB/Spo0J family partition protein [Bacilli bacterium]|nr:ParB/RepB/Spo0J family partition protein [Bacilli bacterium]
METTRRRALGRGLEELFSGEVLDFDSIEEKIIEETPKEEIMQVKLSELRSNPYQPRKVFDEGALNELASSIREHGVFQPIIIKRSIKGYEIVAGERRVKASRLAGRDTIPAIIRDFNDQEMMEIALLENLQREDLNPIEEAMAYQNLMEAKGLNHEQLAARIGKSRSYVTNMVGLMNLPDSVKELVIARKISATHARTLSKIKDPAKVEEMADRIINEGLTTAAIEELAQDKTLEKRNKMERKETEENRTYKYVQDILCDRLSTKVRIRGSKIEINFQDLDDFNRIMEVLNISE